jgi:hypothetical protein
VEDAHGIAATASGCAVLQPAAASISGICWMLSSPITLWKSRTIMG